MVQYKSFDNSNHKLEKSWEKNEANKIEIDNNIRKIIINAESINFSKKLITIPILENQLYTQPISEVIEITLQNYPNWILNHINVLPIVSLIEDTNNDTIYRSFPAIAQAGLLKVGDIGFTNNSKHWIAKTDGQNFILKFYLNINVRVVATVNQPSQGNYSSEPIPFNLDLSLKIINPRIYEKI